MCGIFGYLSPAHAQRQPPGTGLFDAVAALTASDPAQIVRNLATQSDEERAVALRPLEAALRETYRWLTREGGIEVLLDPSALEDMESAAKALTDWIDRFEKASLHAGFPRQRDREFVNRLLVGSRDVLWQIEHDIIDNVEPVRSLLSSGGSKEKNPSVLAHVWQLNVCLRAINRLEVRGRDSAGLVAYLHFPDSDALDGFLEGPKEGRKPWQAELERRGKIQALGHGSILRSESNPSALLVVFKVASEVGRMGDNVAFLRRAILEDRVFQTALRTPGVGLQYLAHTRWASNGIISVPNCHPVDGAFRKKKASIATSRGEVVAVLNGDVDNYLELVEKHLNDQGCALEANITTDAKIIPVVIGRYYRETGDLKEAFSRAFAEFEGSMAIGVMAADRPGEFVFGQKGSGQGLFLGMAPNAVAIASELYGLVELTSQYVKADGERYRDGEVFHLKAQEDGRLLVEVEREGETHELPAERVRTAEIMTRDIHRGDHPHFFLKEIRGSVDSAFKTFQGKFERDGGAIRAHLGPEVLGEELLERMRQGKIRRVFCIGQGTAAVAAQGAAHLIDEALRKSPNPFQVACMKATELSGHYLTDDMSDSLVIAVSQSGTTTDTNRTVDLVRERGAWVIGIVNRRNSDLVFKSNGILYTSDGRDIEMSVASTKAFYSQNVAGQVLALGLAAELGTLSAEELREKVDELERLPATLARALKLEDEVIELSERLTVKRRHWAIVGSGSGKIAADEIRIKLSELCYKSIAVDFVEDKKHIDLSSEPLVIVCANGVPPANVSDLVKEVAIFKAHKSLPIVLVDEGETRFDPYAAGVLRLPKEAGSLSYLVTALVGHLIGYHAARAIDRVSERVRRIRGEVLRTIETGELKPEGGQPSEALETLILELEELLLEAGADSGLGAAAAVRLHAALAFLLGRLSAEGLPATKGESPVDAAMEALSEAVSELARPIDAIKHQAKTVTVGISREQEEQPIRTV